MKRIAVFGVEASSSIRLLTLALCSLGCGGPAAPSAKSAAEPKPAAGPAAAKPAPFDFEAALAREATGLGERAVQGPAAAWTVKVPALGEPKVTPVESVVVVDIPIGPDADVRCQVFEEAVDPAGTLFGVIKESATRVEYKSIEPSGIKLLAGSPAAAVTAFYLTPVEGGKAAGGLKLAIHTSEQRSLLCLLDDLGYAKTFEQVSSAFFASFVAPGDRKSTATYLGVSRARLGEQDVGFSVTRVVPGEKPGERQYQYLSTHLIPTSPNEMAFEDTYSILHLDVKGRLQKGTWVEGSSGEVNLQVTVTREADGKYGYEGQIGGKPVQGRLSAPKGISTMLDTAASLKKKLVSGKPFEETVAEYHPSIDPAALVNVSYVHAKGAPPREVVARLGEQIFTSEVDDDGMSKSGWFEIGKERLTITRERVDGHP